MTATEFWLWFEKNNAKYLFLNDVDSAEKEKLMNDFLGNLHNHCDKLFFEIGGHQNQDQELIITAGGNVDYFDKVEELINLAPEIKDWKFIAFKPPMGFEFLIEYRDLKFDPENIWFLPLRSPSHPEVLGIKVALPNFSQDNKQDFLAGVYLLLDAGLGERRAAMDINYVEVDSLPEEPEDQGFMKLTELSEFIDWWQKKKPSDEAEGIS